MKYLEKIKPELMPEKITQIEEKLKALKDLNDKVPFNMLELYDSQ